MSNELHAARELVRAVEHLDRLKMFDLNVQGTEMRLSWINGSAMGGYQELAADISVIVSEGWSVLRLEAISRADARVELARAALRAAIDPP